MVAQIRRPEALVDFLEQREAWAFGYGAELETHDCARFCGAGFEAVTGVNPLDTFAGRWTSERGARRIIAAHGGLAAAVETVMRPIDPTLAQRGDVGMTDAETLVLIEGDTVVGPAAPRGLKRMSRAVLTRAWTA
jgi:hypothetical protein